LASPGQSHSGRQRADVKKVVCGGKAKPDLREFKRKAGTLKEDGPSETKSSQRKKPKDASKPQKRDRKRASRTGGAG
jgi:hypothetical protein